MKATFYSISFFFFFLFAAPMMTANGGSVNAAEYMQDYMTHVVERGETSYSIARKHNITLNDLYILNPDAKENIKIGDELRILVLRKVKLKSYKPQKGETLYSIALKNQVTIEDILALNPKLNEEGLKEGKKINIPVFADPNLTVNGILHKVQGQETLYSISKQYNLSIEDIIALNPAAQKGLRKDMLLAIPRGGSKNQTDKTAVAKKKESEKKISEKLDKVRIAILLPFLDKDGNKNDRYLEYYEGFLLAVDELKSKGVNLEIYTFDIGAGGDNNKLQGLLETNDIASVHMVLGGVTNEQIALISEFSNKKGIKYVIPFPSKSNEILTNKYIFQASVSNNDLSEKVSRLFLNRYKTDNIVFLINKENDDKTEVVNAIKNALDKASVSYTTINMTTNKNVTKTLKESLSKFGKTIVMPSSSSYAVLAKVVGILNTTMAGSTEYDVDLFGYPDWQSFTRMNAEMSRYGTYFYTPFYPKNAESVANLETKFENTYNLKMMNTTPKFGVMGYDVAMYFISALYENGVNFDKNFSKIKYNSLQNALHFVQKNANGGYINDGLYLVNLSDLGIERIDCSNQ